MRIYSLMLLALIFSLSSTSVFAKKKPKVDICHKGETINVSGNALDAHIGHGDFQGACEEMPKVVVIFRCDSSGNVSPVSYSMDLPSDSNPLNVPEGEESLSCADTIVAFFDLGFEMNSIKTGTITMMPESTEPPAEPAEPEQGYVDFATEYLFIGKIKPDSGQAIPE